MQEAKIGISPKKTDKISNALNQLLANQHILYIKMRNYHWNLTGTSFVEVHEFIEKLYSQLAADIDEIAERILQIGKTASGSMKEFLEHATLEEAEGAKIAQESAIQQLVNDYERMIRILREIISDFEENQNDPGTVDILTRIIQSYEKNAWMLRRYER